MEFILVLINHHREMCRLTLTPRKMCILCKMDEFLNDNHFRTRINLFY